MTVFIGTLVSYFTSRADDTYEAKLLHPLIVKCLNFMPGEPRQFKQPPAPVGIVNQENHRTSICPSVITVEIQEKNANGHDNFGYEKETNGLKERIQRINNMTMLPTEENLVLNDKESTVISAEITGVYKRNEVEC